MRSTLKISNQENIITGFTIKGVITFAAINNVIACPGTKLVIAETTENPIVSCTYSNNIVT